MDNGDESQRLATEPDATRGKDAQLGQDTVAAIGVLSRLDRLWNLLSLLPVFALPTYILFVSILQAWHGDPSSSLAFAGPAYALLAALVVTVRAVDRTPREDAPRRRGLVVVVWALSALLQLMFTWRVAQLVPAAATSAWCAAAVFQAAALWICFCRWEGRRKES